MKLVKDEMVFTWSKESIMPPQTTMFKWSIAFISQVPLHWKKVIIWPDGPIDVLFDTFIHFGFSFSLICFYTAIIKARYSLSGSTIFSLMVIGVYPSYTQ